MTDLLLFAESLFVWHVVNYALSTDPVRDDKVHPEIADDVARNWRSWLVGVGSRSLAAAILVIATNAFDRASFLIAGIIFAGSILLPVARRLIPVASLAEFELLANGLAALSIWLVCAHVGTHTAPPSFIHLNPDPASALFICVALCIYAVRGGSYLVRGVLEKAGGIPPPAVLTNESYTHGRIIGQVERAIVILIVMAGNLQALAFFFAAKGHSFPRTRRTSTSRLPAPRVSYQLSHRSRCRARPAEDLGSLVEVDLHHIAKTWAPVPARDELA